MSHEHDISKWLPTWDYYQLDDLLPTLGQLPARSICYVGSFAINAGPDARLYVNTATTAYDEEYVETEHLYQKMQLSRVVCNEDAYFVDDSHYFIVDKAGVNKRFVRPKELPSPSPTVEIKPVVFWAGNLAQYKYMRDTVLPIELNLIDLEASFLHFISDEVSGESEEGGSQSAL